MSKLNTVDADARRKAAQLFRNYISGRITNDEFFDRMPATRDRGVNAICETAYFLFQDIMKKRRLEGRHALTSDVKRECVRWILFLHSDREYLWPDIPVPGWDPTPRIEKSFWSRVWRRARLQYVVKPKDGENFLAAGHVPVWPFISVADYKAALKTPRFLSGHNMNAAQVTARMRPLSIILRSC